MISIDANSDFSLHNIPFGCGMINNHVRACTRLGDFVIDLEECRKKNVFEGLHLPEGVFTQPCLNDFIALGKLTTSSVRKMLIQLFSSSVWSEKNITLHPASGVNMVLPINIGDYTDFYSSREHATNVGIMFRDPQNALLPNWLHLPVGYHGRASSICVSGTPVIRPKGQILPASSEEPVFSPTQQLDFELEMGFIIGKNTRLGQSVSTKDAEDYIFGMVLFNDWSARDIQKWEYVPLGPFLAKNFASTMSPWIVTMDALEPFRVAGPDQHPEVLSYLQYEGAKNYDIQLTVNISNSAGISQQVSHSNFRYMYWNMCQQLAHHTVNGCNIRVGDLMASGTISGPTPDSYGSMLEIAWKGTKPVSMPDGTDRKFIQDHDTVTLKGWAELDGIRVGFGECSAKVLPSE